MTPSAETPAGWLTGNRHLLPTAGTALDVACGRGRHALWLAGQGFRVTAVDRDATALGHLAEGARARGLAGIVTAVMDLERDGDDVLPAEGFDVIVVVHYLHRPLFPQLLAALRPGGVLVYETFLAAQALRGRPSNPAFLLQPGELVARAMGQWPGQTTAVQMQVLAEREGDFEQRMVASVVARRV